jgi:hypothetical protein
MSDKGKGIHLLPGLSAVAITMLLASFSATPAAAQGKAAGISDSALQSALQRGLPGAVADHTGKGALRPETRAWAPGWRPAQST